MLLVAKDSKHFSVPVVGCLKMTDHWLSRAAVPTLQHKPSLGYRGARDVALLNIKTSAAAHQLQYGLDIAGFDIHDW